MPRFAARPLRPCLRPCLRFSLLAIAASLNACNGGGGGDKAICRTLSQSVVSATANPGSSLADGDRAMDGNLGSYATLTPAAANGGAVLRNALGQRNGGEVAGLAFTTPGAGTVSISVTTYLGNVQRETGQAGSTTYGTSQAMTCPGYCLNASNGQSFFGFRTTMPYDAFQVTISSTSTSPLQLRELCVD